VIFRNIPLIENINGKMRHIKILDVLGNPGLYDSKHFHSLNIVEQKYGPVKKVLNVNFQNLNERYNEFLRNKNKEILKKILIDLLKCSNVKEYDRKATLENYLEYLSYIHRIESGSEIELNEIDFYSKFLSKVKEHDINITQSPDTVNSNQGDGHRNYLKSIIEHEKHYIFLDAVIELPSFKDKQNLLSSYAGIFGTSIGEHYIRLIDADRCVFLSALKNFDKNDSYLIEHWEEIINTKLGSNKTPFKFTYIPNEYDTKVNLENIPTRVPKVFIKANSFADMLEIRDRMGDVHDISILFDEIRHIPSLETSLKKSALYQLIKSKTNEMTMATYM
jgi:hypothetical protein